MGRRAASRADDVGVLRNVGGTGTALSRATASDSRPHPYELSPRLHFTSSFGHGCAESPAPYHTTTTELTPLDHVESFQSAVKLQTDDADNTHLANTIPSSPDPNRYRSPIMAALNPFKKPVDPAVSCNLSPDVTNTSDSHRNSAMPNARYSTSMAYPAAKRT